MIPVYLPRKGQPNYKNRLRAYQVGERDGRYCCVCGESSPGALTLDHFIKKAAGGEDDLSNLQILCRACHDYKDNNGKPPMRILMLYWNK